MLAYNLNTTYICVMKNNITDMINFFLVVLLEQPTDLRLMHKREDQKLEPYKESYPIVR